MLPWNLLRAENCELKSFFFGIRDENLHVSVCLEFFSSLNDSEKIPLMNRAFIQGFSGAQFKEEGKSGNVFLSRWQRQNLSCCARTKISWFPSFFPLSPTLTDESGAYVKFTYIWEFSVQWHKKKYFSKPVSYVTHTEKCKAVSLVARWKIPHVCQCPATSWKMRCVHVMKSKAMRPLQ